ncbi:MAG: zinc ribbon domain-containing protein [Firmicutes bacterium]|nr:zinc ribbon domain-containing protein [Bacillota bacterium]
MNCKKCNVEIPEGSSFCIECGEPIHTQENANVDLKNTISADIKKKAESTIGNTIERMGVYMFWVCIILGIIVTFVGGIRFLSGIGELDATIGEGWRVTLMDTVEYSWEYDGIYDCYYGKQTVITGIVLLISSIMFILVQGFGNLIETCSQINKKIQNL